MQCIRYDSGEWTAYTYNDAKKTYSTLNTAGETTTTIYNDFFMPVSYTDEYGSTTTYTYDNHYRLTAESCDGYTTTYTYNTDGTLASEATEGEKASMCSGTLIFAATHKSGRMISAPTGYKKP